ncbi:hypothetical protein EPI10_020729 [Gossypium australe]|uniref:Uncharacterized protein n=1 Tax=Gossypium australe TaxID=47621 RepID=A0A5B6WEQ0_9ROSI|nr:hypothetical protein EPI10_020729 [Gossypium australe]
MTHKNIPRENLLFDEANANPPSLPPPQQLPTNINMARKEGTLREYALSSSDMVQRSITRPAITANNFEIKQAMI